MSGRSKRIKWERFNDEIGALMSKTRDYVRDGVEESIAKVASKTARDLRTEKKYLPRYVPQSGENKSRRTMLGIHSGTIWKKSRNSKEKSKREPGTYIKSFAQKKMQKISKNPDDIRRIVYVKNGEYRLSHLLENGHRVANQNGFYPKVRTRSIPHFYPAQKNAEKELLKRTKECILTSLGSIK